MRVRETGLRAFLVRTRAAVRRGDVVVTYKADEELEAMGWDRSDLLRQLLDLRAEHFLRRERSRYDDDAILWVFCPPLWDDRHLWMRLKELEPTAVLVVSVHPAGGDPWSQ